MKDFAGQSAVRRVDSVVSKVDSYSPDLVVSMLGASMDCVKLVSIDGALEFMNFNGRTAMEIAEFDAIRGLQWASLWPEESRGLIEDAVAEAALGRQSRFDAYCPTAKGDPRWWDVAVSPILSEFGGVSGVLSISRDITERVRREEEAREAQRELARQVAIQNKAIADRDAALEERALMMREIDHRIKNSLSMVGALLRLQMAELTEPEARKALENSANRVASIAAVHSQLYQGGIVGEVSLVAYLRGLIADLRLTLPLRVELCDALDDQNRSIVKAEVAVGLGMIVAEAVANAGRHAFGADGGKIEIALSRGPKGAQRLTVTDNGRGFGENGPQGDGLGMKVINAGAKRAGAEVEFASAPGGAEVCVVMRG